MFSNLRIARETGFFACRFVFVLAIAPAFAQTQQKLIPKIDLPPGAPVAMLADDWSDSKVSPRGGALMVDVRGALSFRNSSRHRIRAITLAVLSQEVTPGGKGSVSVPSLDVAPDDAFPINVDLHLMGPIGALGGPRVNVSLDGVLFDDLSFYGPDMLHSRRTMTVWEMEARRDRQYFKKLLETAGGKGLQDAIIDSISRQASDPPPGGVQVMRGRATNSDPEREVAYAFLHFPGAPVDASSGMVRITGTEAHAPRVAVKNQSARPVRYVEIGWIVKDQDGREFQAISMPSDVSLAPKQSGNVGEDMSMWFTKRTSIQSMTGFVSSVGFSDGSYWIPDRSVLNDAKLKRVVAPSPEEQRLAELYRKRGLTGLIEELKKF